MTNPMAAESWGTCPSHAGTVHHVFAVGYDSCACGRVLVRVGFGGTKFTDTRTSGVVLETDPNALQGQYFTDD